MNKHTDRQIELNTHRKTKPTTNNPTPVTTATIPYIKGTLDMMARILQPYDIGLAHRQTYNYFTTPTNQRQGQRTTSRQTGSGVQNQMYWLTGYLYWGDWQKLEDKTD